MQSPKSPQTNRHHHRRLQRPLQARQLPRLYLEDQSLWWMRLRIPKERGMGGTLGSAMFRAAFLPGEAAYNPYATLDHKSRIAKFSHHHLFLDKVRKFYIRCTSKDMNEWCLRLHQVANSSDDHCVRILHK